MKKIWNLIKINKWKMIHNLEISMSTKWIRNLKLKIMLEKMTIFKIISINLDKYNYKTRKIKLNK